MQSLRKKKVDSYLTREKLNLLGDKSYRSRFFKAYAIQNLQFFKAKLFYEIGLEVKTTEWLMDMFKDISSSDSILSFFKCVDQLINIIV